MRILASSESSVDRERLLHLLNCTRLGDPSIDGSIVRFDSNPAVYLHIEEGHRHPRRTADAINSGDSCNIGCEIGDDTAQSVLSKASRAEAGKFASSHCSW
jgi:hypothetical protein